MANSANDTDIWQWLDRCQSDIAFLSSVRSREATLLTLSRLTLRTSSAAADGRGREQTASVPFVGASSGQRLCETKGKVYGRDIFDRNGPGGRRKHCGLPCGSRPQAGFMAAGRRNVTDRQVGRPAGGPTDRPAGRQTDRIGGSSAMNKSARQQQKQAKRLFIHQLCRPRRRLTDTFSDGGRRQRPGDQRLRRCFPAAQQRHHQLSVCLSVLLLAS